MLPANLAKGRAAAAARGLGEFLMVTNPPGPGSQVMPALRYSPYTLPSLELSPGSGCSSTSTPTPATISQHSLATISPSTGNIQQNNFHQALMQANLQQIQMLGVEDGGLAPKYCGCCMEVSLGNVQGLQTFEILQLRECV